LRGNWLSNARFNFRTLTRGFAEKAEVERFGEPGNQPVHLLRADAVG
jgi:hypothetical protein